MGIIFATVHVQTRHVVQSGATRPREVSAKVIFSAPPPHLLAG